MEGVLELVVVSSKRLFRKRKIELVQLERAHGIAQLSCM